MPTLSGVESQHDLMLRVVYHALYRNAEVISDLVDGMGEPDAPPTIRDHGMCVLVHAANLITQAADAIGIAKNMLYGEDTDDDHER